MPIRPATSADTGAIFDLLTLRSRAAFGVSELKRDDVVRALALDGSEHVVEDADGVVAGYGSLDSAHALTIAAMDDEVNDALLVSLLDRARARGFDSVHAIVVPEDRPFHALVQRAAFAHHGDVLRMWRELDGDLPEPAFPDGIVVRTYADDDAERVHRLLDEAYGAWDDTYAPRPHADWLRFMTQHEEFDPELWFLVERDGELVACALHWKEHQRRGWVKDIAVAESERGRGVGKALLFRGLRAYAGRGAERVGLKVDSTNPTGALQLYERVGFVVDRRYGTWVKDL